MNQNVEKLILFFGWWFDESVNFSNSNRNYLFCILVACPVEVLSTSADQESKASNSASETTSNEHTQYAYNRKGQLVVNNYPFLRSGIKGADNTSIEWRCADGRKYRCNARVRTHGKTMQVINVVHNHEPRKQKQFSAIVWTENK